VEETGTLTLPISPHLLKANTKGKLATRSIPVIEDLRQLLTNYYPIGGDVYLFPMAATDTWLKIAPQGY
jgi:hypothetical protein